MKRRVGREIVDGYRMESSSQNIGIDHAISEMNALYTTPKLSMALIRRCVCKMLLTGNFF